MHSNMEEEMKTLKSRKFPQYIAGLVITIGPFISGILIGWTSPTETQLLNGDYGFQISPNMFSWISSVYYLGGIFSCIPVAVLMNRIGRKWTLMSLVLPFLVGWCLVIWSQDVWMMLVGRFIMGICGAASCSCSVTYTAEIADKQIRGQLGAFTQMMISAGLLFVYCVGIGLNVFWLSVVCGCVPLVYAALLLFMPESPTFLVVKDRREEAIKTLQWLRGKNYDYQMELDELYEIQNKLKGNKTSTREALSRRATLKALGTGIGMTIFQQMSGVSAIVSYDTQIFKDAGTHINENLCSIIVAVVQWVSVLISIFIIDRFGRRTLLIFSSIIMCISALAMGIYFYLKQIGSGSVPELGWLPLTSLCLYIIVYSLGLGPIAFLIIGELFANDIKDVGTAISGSFTWIAAFAVEKAFINMKETLGSDGTFWVFSGICLLSAIFVYFAVIETKGKSLQQIQDELNGSSSGRRKGSSNRQLDDNSFSGQESSPPAHKYVYSMSE